MLRCFNLTRRPIAESYRAHLQWRLGSHFLRVVSAAWICFLFLLTVGRPAQAQSNSDPSEMQIVLTGDSLINQRLSVFENSNSVGVYQTVRAADAAFTNFETLVLDHPTPGAAQSGGAYQSSPAWVLDELKWAGFNLFSTANNHAYDFGVEGVRSNLKAFESRGLTHAGSGENLAFARAPAYLDTKRGTVALVAMASTLTDGSYASDQRRDFIGRPGVNPLRFKTTYTVDHDAFHALQKVSKSLLNGDGSATTDGPDPTVDIGGVTFQEGDVASVHMQVNKDDLAGLIASVRNAHRQAEWVIVSSHTHEEGLGGLYSPPEFLITAAHAAIDAGADIFVAHGPHVLRGIEIYRGKPIFYSLGDFILQNETMEFQPSESYDSVGLPPSANISDYFDSRYANDTRSFPAIKAVWESVIAKVYFTKSHTLDRVILTPISLGFQEPRSERGHPRLASAEQAKETIENLSRLSAQFGAKVSFSDGVGAVTGLSNAK
jgi:poly-gamma-glutamate synthesis protein (capsule biosynthesis protein)